MSLLNFKKAPVKTRIMGGLLIGFFTTIPIYMMGIYSVLEKMSIGYYLFYFFGMTAFGFLWFSYSWRDINK